MRGWGRSWGVGGGHTSACSRVGAVHQSHGKGSCHGPGFLHDAAVGRQRKGQGTRGLADICGCGGRWRQLPLWDHRATRVLSKWQVPQVGPHITASIYQAAKLAAYKKKTRVIIGTHSNVGRHQVNTLRAHVHGRGGPTTHLEAQAAEVQQCILRRIFWPRLWSGLRVSTFRVLLENNPADPMSRVGDFPQRRQARQEAERQRAAWEGDKMDPKYMHLTAMPRGLVAATTSQGVLCGPPTVGRRSRS